MSGPSQVFDRHYQQYLSALSALDLEKAAQAAGARLCSGEAVGLTYFNAEYRVSGQGIQGPDRRTPGYDTCTILSRYLIMAGERPEMLSSPQGWTGFRDLKDSGPLTVYFRDNVEGAIARVLAGKGAGAAALLAPISGRSAELDARYDLVLEFSGLPNIPLLLLFNDAEDGFPAFCSVLFRTDAEVHLDAECLAMLGVRLARLIRRSMIPGAEIDSP